MSETKKWVCITEVANIPLREGRSVRVSGCDIAIFNLGARFLALENRCPHQGGPLAEGIISGTNVACPLHAWKVSLETGMVTNRPDTTACVETFPVSVREGLIFVEVPVAPKTKEKNPAACEGTDPACWVDSRAMRGDGRAAKNLDA
jgi:nitrite reductase (NADH) small subunit